MTDNNKKSKETRIALRGWLVPGKDDALIAEWSNVPDGERDGVIKEALEHYFQIPMNKRRNPLVRLLEDMARVVRAIDEMRNLLHELSTRPVALGNPNGRSAPALDPELEAKARERDRNMKKSMW